MCHHLKLNVVTLLNVSAVLDLFVLLVDIVIYKLIFSVAFFVVYLAT